MHLRCKTCNGCNPKLEGHDDCVFCKCREMETHLEKLTTCTTPDRNKAGTMCACLGCINTARLKDETSS